MSRESKKDKLRRQIVSPQQPAWNAEPEEDSEAVVRRAHNRVLRHRWILVLLVLLLIAAGAAAWFFYQRNYRYSGYETAWQVDLNEGSLVGYESFGTNVLKYTKDGASYLDNRGRTVWTESYEMKSPIISVKGDYAAIADMQGNSIYICNTDGTLGQATTVLRLLCWKILLPAISHFFRKTALPWISPSRPTCRETAIRLISHCQMTAPS